MKVKEADENSLRFLFRENQDQPIQIYKCVRRPLGERSAPCCANYTIKRCCEDSKAEFPLAAEIADRSFYVDDCLTSVNDKDQAIQMFKMENKRIWPFFFLDENGIIRAKGRLQHATIPYSVKHPIIIDGNSPLAEQIVSQMHQHTKHGSVNQVLNELRQTYWILKAKQVVKKYTWNCWFCKTERAKLSRGLMADLPNVRVTPNNTPFTSVMCNYFQSITVKDKATTRRSIQQKRWGCIFTFLATRAVHLELVTDLSTSAFINCLIRCTSRRGTCKDIYSDRGTNFIGADAEIKKNLDVDQITNSMHNRGINCHFGSPLSPHKTGDVERMVRSVKRGLRSLQESIYNSNVLHTALVDIEGSLNSRPLIELPVTEENPNDSRAITPNYLLLLKPDVGMPLKVDASISTPELQFDQRQKTIIGLKYTVDSEFIKRHPAPNPEDIKNSLITSAGVTCAISLGNGATIPVAVHYRPKSVTGEDILSSMENEIKIIQTCELCLENQPSDKHILSSDRSCCEMVTTDFESCNKNALLQIADMLEDESIPPYLEALVPLPDVVHLGKNIKCSCSNWFINLDGEYSNLVLIRTLRDDAETEIRKKMKELLTLERSQAISYVDLHNKVKIKVSSLKKRDEVVSQLKRFRLDTAGTVSVLKSRLPERLDAITDTTEHLEYVKIDNNLKKPSALCVASKDVLLCADETKGTCSFVEVKEMCSIENSLMVTDGDAGTVKLVTGLSGTVTFLKMLGKLYDSFDIHLRGASIELVSLHDALDNVKSVERCMLKTVQDVKEHLGLKESAASNGPEDTISHQTQTSLTLLTKGIERLASNINKINGNFIGDMYLKTLLTTQVKNLHAVSHFKHETFSVLEYAQDFDSVVKESLQRTTNWAAKYYTRDRSYYPVPETSMPLTAAKAIAPLQSQTAFKETELSMKAFFLNKENSNDDDDNDDDDDDDDDFKNTSYRHSNAIQPFGTLFFHPLSNW
ncbi:hypothetical protein AC249_AIPGENE9328 [Exaiptasia diaphana]|nr:hypothetical protein AC249_AIPGENE9328 [Exaiptasia diaphana]